MLYSIDGIFRNKTHNSLQYDLKDFENHSYAIYRQTNKDNMPVIDELEVEAHKRAKLLGVGGINLKKLYVETGVQVSRIPYTNRNLLKPTFFQKPLNLSLNAPSCYVLCIMMKIVFPL